MSNRAWRASINQTEVGSLQEVNELWHFHDASNWLNHPQCFPLSPHLPLTFRNAAARRWRARNHAQDHNA